MQNQNYAEHDIHYTTFIRLPFPRGDFVDPPVIDWDAAKDRVLWKILFQNPRAANIDWKEIASRFEVPLAFMLQQAALLYERQLFQVREQMQKFRRSNVTTPATGTEPLPPMSGQHSMQLGSSDGTRHPVPSFGTSRFGAGTQGSIASDLLGKARFLGSSSKMGQPVARGSQIPQTTSAATVTQTGNAVTSISTEYETDAHRKATSPGTSRNNSTPTNQQPDVVSSSESSSESEYSSSSTHEEPNKRALRSQIFRRKSTNNDRISRIRSHGDDLAEEETDDDTPTFLPFAAPTTVVEHQDLGETLRSPRQNAATSETKAQRTPMAEHMTVRSSQKHVMVSDGTPSMGSSFSDLDDSSLTQSALEEALLSNMQRGSTASRISNASQRSRS